MQINRQGSVVVVVLPERVVALGGVQAENFRERDDEPWNAVLEEERAEDKCNEQVFSKDEL